MEYGYVMKTVLFDNEVKKVEPRKEPDLPIWITGSAQWKQPSNDQQGNILPPSYHCFYENGWFSLELINEQWYWLELSLLLGYASVTLDEKMIDSRLRRSYRLASPLARPSE